MKTQNYSNHPKLVFGYHFFTLLASFILFIVSVVNLVYASGALFKMALLLTIGFFILCLTALYARVFSLRAQDRVIRAEENFRHYLMTQKTLPAELTIRQIIGLRFASDDEYLDLVDRAVKEKLTEKEIKKSIKNWRGDYYRV